MPQTKILNVRQGTRLNDQGRAVRTMVATYKVGDWGPFEVEIDADKFTADTLNAAVQAQAQHLTMLQAQQ